MAEHRFEVGDGWSVWRQIFLRGAGFPMTQVLALHSPQASAAADALVLHEVAGAELRSAAERELRAGKLDDEHKKECKKVLARLKKGTPLAASKALQDRYPSVRDFVGWQSVRDSLREAFIQNYAESEVSLDRTMAEIASDARLQEAITWQNAAAAKNVLPALRDANRKRTSKQRMRWRLVANYLQRYCTKNDTIGFFGPVGWAEVVPDLELMRFRAGERLLARRRVYFETWPIDALAQKFSLEESLWPSIVPRRNPNGYLDGVEYHDSDDDISELPEEFCVALRACDAEHTIREIAQSLMEQGITDTEDEGYEILLTLSQHGLIYDRFEITSNTRYPLESLRALLENAPEDEARDQALAELEELEAMRRAVEAAAGQPDELDQAMEELNRCFERLTDSSSARAGGKAYAGRTLIYEDCIRDVEVEFSEALFRRLSEPLLLVMRSARWFCWELAQRYRREFRRVFDELCEEHGYSEVGLLSFFEKSHELFPSEESRSSTIDDVCRAHQEKWASVLRVDATERRMNIEVDAIRPDVERAFDAPGPGWPAARHQSPDILLAAESIDALQKSDVRAVLGEVHVGQSTVAFADNKDEHLHPERLIEAFKADLPVAIAPTTNNPLRIKGHSISDEDFEMESGVGLSHRPRNQVWATGSCVVFLKDDELYVRSRDGGPEFHIIAFFQDHFKSAVLSDFKIMGSHEKHNPRVTIGDLVIQRETWRFDADEVPGTSQMDRDQAYLEVRRWAHEMGFPRFIFVKTQAENKPFFVDLESIVLVSNFVRHALVPGRVTVSEMLPDFDHAWLEDGEGQRYCSELRLCYVDPVEWSP